MPYKYDFFYSYKRNPANDHWHARVARLLAHYVGEELQRGQDAPFFLDKEDIRNGDIFNNRILGALKSSRCIVCALSPNYFKSKYCLDELNTFIARSSELVACFSSHDGESFPIEFQKTWQWNKWDEYYATSESFWNSTRSLEFESKLKELAMEISDKIKHAPKFSDGVPMYISPVEPSIISLPRPSDVD